MSADNTATNNKRSLRSRLVLFAFNPFVILALRTLQFIFAIVVTGAMGRTLHLFRGYDVVHHEGKPDTHENQIRFPDSWAFMLFTAIWTVLTVIFTLFTAYRYPAGRYIGYARVGVEVIALISWFVAFITSAIYVGQESCPLVDGVCGSVNLAVAIGTVEAILFLITAPQVASLVFYVHHGLGGGNNENDFVDIRSDDHTDNNGHRNHINVNNTEAYNNTRPMEETKPEKSVGSKPSAEWEPVFQPDNKVYAKMDV